jgi:glycosyltransferase involved in cell wall biosynthesis
VTSVPVVTVITPTWKRHGLLLERCIPSVQKQGHPAVEHLVISDGLDPVLRNKLRYPWLNGWKGLWYGELPAHDPEHHYGHHARAWALSVASGEYVTYCDDDDALQPHHCHMLAAALEADPGAGFAVSRMVSHGPGGTSVIGHGEIACGNVGTPMIMHRRELADLPGVTPWVQASQYEDWELVLAWINEGVAYVRVDAETSDVWPSLYRGN